jgi:hypothetical protein
MAHFYASIQGNRGEATRMGSKDSGITGHIRGWNVGARVDVAHVDGRDVVRIYRTLGSGARSWGSDELIAEFTADESAVTR